MSYHPSATAHGQQHTLSAQHAHTVNSPSQATGNTNNSLSGSSDAVQLPAAVDYDHLVLPSRAQLNQEIYEAKVARDQGLISPLQYCEVLAKCLLVGRVRIDRAKQCLRKSMEGEDTRELRKRAFDLTDRDLDESMEQTRRRVETKIENRLRSEQGMLRRTITRGL